MTLPAAPLSRTRERLAIGVLAVGAFAIAINVNLVGPMFAFAAGDPIYASLGEDEQKATIGQLLWVTGGAATLASLLLGPIVDRVGRRTPMVLGSILFALAMLAHVVVRNHGELLVARALSGLAGGVVFTGASAAVADIVPYHRRGAAMGLFSVGLFLATPVGLPIGVELAKHGPEAWRWSFGWLAGPAALVAVGMVWFLPHGLGRSGVRVTQLEVLRQPHVGAALLSVLLYTGAFFTAVQFAPSWLDETGVMPREQQSWLWVVLGICTLLGSIVLPRIADRIGKRVMVLATTGGVAIGLLLLARVSGPVALGSVGVPLALLASARTPALAALMSEIAEPRMRGTLMGLRAAAVNCGQFAFAALGAEINRAQGFTTLLHAAAAGVLVAYLIVRFRVKVDL